MKDLAHLEADTVVASYAPGHVERRFLCGQCHVLALVLNRRSGLRLHGLFDTTDGAMHHAFVVDDETGLAWDIRGGRRPERIHEGSCVTKPRVAQVSEIQVVEAFGRADRDEVQAARHAAERYILPTILLSRIPAEPEVTGPELCP